MKRPVRILGIDPGSRTTGFGVITVTAGHVSYVASGCIKTRQKDFTARLRVIFEDTGRILAEHRPEELAIERVFMHRNADSALKLGHARAAAMCATFSNPVPVHEYSPREVKQAVTGTGGADKTQVEEMVRRLLGLRGSIQSDAADALAVAICHAHMRDVSKLVEQAPKGRATG